LLDGFATIKIDDKEDTRFNHWCGLNPQFINHLRVWGEAGTVKIKTATTPKLADRGVQCVFVGYATGHSGDTYRMWDPKTGGVHLSRDVIWLRRMYYQPNDENNDEPDADDDDAPTLRAEEGVAPAQQNQNANDEESSEESSASSETSNDNDDDKSGADDQAPAGQPTRSGRTVRPPQ
jgi:hypothetical protein